MAQEFIDLTAPDADSLPVGAAKINANFTELYSVKLDASGYTAADVLTKIKTVDGAGSGLDADLFDGQSSAAFLLASSYTAADVLAKLLTVDGAGSTLDADTLDGMSSAAFALAAHTHGNSQITDLVYSKLTALPGSLVSTTSTMAGAQNNLNLGATNKRFRVTPAVGGTTLSGVVAGAAGDELVMYNISATEDFALTNEDANSTAANRILTASGTPVVVRPGGSVRLWYDGTSARWRNEGRIA